jgi:hypothetical protein
MNSFQVRQLVVICIHAEAKEESGITSIDNLIVPELRHRLSLLYIHSTEHAPLRSLTGTSDLEELPAYEPPHEAEPSEDLSG